MKIKAENCYFAIDQDVDNGIVITIVPKEHWNEYGYLDDNLVANSFEQGEFPDFLEEALEATFICCEDDLSFEEIKDKMASYGFEFSLELQAFMNELKSSNDNEEFDEAMLENEVDEDEFWRCLNFN